jgi:hypothetical protein
MEALQKKVEELEAKLAIVERITFIKLELRDGRSVKVLPERFDYIHTVNADGSVIIQAVAKIPKSKCPNCNCIVDGVYCYRHCDVHDNAKPSLYGYIENGKMHMIPQEHLCV